MNILNYFFKLKIATSIINIQQYNCQGSLNYYKKNCPGFYLSIIKPKQCEVMHTKKALWYFRNSHITNIEPIVIRISQAKICKIHIIITFFVVETS